MDNFTVRDLIKRLGAFLLCLILGAASLTPAFAQEAEKPVRVGWYESPFNITDEFGRRSGYAYEYQRKIAAYTGWRYEYVEGTWSELMEMLSRGEIDLMSDVSYMAERTEYLLYPNLPMGTEAYYIFTALNDTRISSEDVSSLNGKKVGVTKNSIQKGLFLEWAEKHGVQVELVEVTAAEDESLSMMLSGQLDAFLTMDSYSDPETIVPVWKIGSSDFYFAVNRARPDLLAELDAAMSRIQDENRFYNEELNEKYMRSSGSNMYLNAGEKAWLDGHGVIRVGYQDNYLAFCASDENGQLTGALKDYLSYAATALENVELSFEAVAYPTAAAAMEALKNGEVDCMFPANLNANDSETMGVVMSPTLMRTEMDAVVRAADQKAFIRKEQVTVAVNEGNPNYEMFLVDNYPGWQTVHYVDTPACLDQVAAGNADCIIISNYRFSNIAKQCEKLRLTTVSTGVELDYCFAIRPGDTELYSIIAKVTGMVPASSVNAALTYYSTEDAKLSFTDYIMDHLPVVMAVIIGVALVIIVLLLLEIRAAKKANEEQHLVETLNKRVFVDALTSVRNKGAYADYIQKLQDRLDQGEAFQFAMGVFDCDDLKTINDDYGHDKGDLYLKAASRLICRTFQHSPVFRIGGDEFAVVLLNEDYENRDALISQFDQASETLCAEAENQWDRVSVARGIAVYDPEIDPAVIDTVRRADKIMYENKRIRKNRA